MAALQEYINAQIEAARSTANAATATVPPARAPSVSVRRRAAAGTQNVTVNVAPI